MYEWDAQKAVKNAAKHDVTFEEAVTVFLDAEGIDGDDWRHSLHEARRWRVGRSDHGHILSVTYTLRGPYAEDIRLITARQASRRERAAYAAPSPRRRD